MIARQASNLGIGGLAPGLAGEPVGEDMYDCAVSGMWPAMCAFSGPDSCG
jgi:hypothetical protein